MSGSVEGSVFGGIFSVLVVFLFIQNSKLAKKGGAEVDGAEGSVTRTQSLNGDGFVVRVVMLSCFLFFMIGLPREMGVVGFYFSKLTLFLPGAILSCWSDLFSRTSDQSLALLFVWVGLSFYIVFGWHLNVWTVVVFLPILYCFWKRMFR